jgi:serine protease
VNNHSRVALALTTTIAIAGLGNTGGVDPARLTERTDERAAEAAPHEAIVRFDAATAYGAAMRAIHDVGGLVARQGRGRAHFLVSLDPDVPFADAIARLERMPGVAWAEPNGLVRKSGAVPEVFRPNDSFFQFQWHLRMLNAERTWAIQAGDPSIVVAVLDTGVAFEDFGVFRRAPDWGNTRFVRGLNVLDGSPHANDDDGHGTHVASTIAEGTNNVEGGAGLAFGCALMPVKVLDNEGLGTFFDVAEGIYYAFRDAPQKARVINLSLGGGRESRVLGDAIDDAVSAGTVIVAASGNEGSEVSFPASHPRVIAVGAVDMRKRRADYSNFGTTLDLVAFGGDVDRDDDRDGDPDGILQQTFSVSAAQRGIYDRFGYFYFNGTSQAAPQVAALAALLIRQGITTPLGVQLAMQATAEDLGATGRDDQFGHGLIRPVEALSGLGLNR